MSLTQTRIQCLYAHWARLGKRYGNLIEKNNSLAVRLAADDHPDRFGLVEDHYSQFVEPVSDEVLDLEVRLMHTPPIDINDLTIKARILAQQDGLIDDEFNRLVREDADRLLGYVNI